MCQTHSFSVLPQLLCPLFLFGQWAYTSFCLSLAYIFPLGWARVTSILLLDYLLFYFFFAAVHQGHCRQLFQQNLLEPYPWLIDFRWEKITSMHVIQQKKLLPNPPLINYFCNNRMSWIHIELLDFLFKLCKPLILLYSIFPFRWKDFWGQCKNRFNLLENVVFFLKDR